MAIEKPKAGPLAQLTDQDFFDFISNLGMPVFRTPLAAAFARHNWPLNTIKDYLDIHPTEASVVRLAKEFWKDLAAQRLSTRDFVWKWFGMNEEQAASRVSEELSDLRSGNA